MGKLSLLFLALGTAMFLEGLPYFLSPRAVRRTMEFVGQMRDGSLRLVGLTLMAIGLMVAYLATR